MLWGACRREFFQPETVATGILENQILSELAFCEMLQIHTIPSLAHASGPKYRGALAIDEPTFPKKADERAIKFVEGNHSISSLLLMARFECGVRPKFLENLAIRHCRFRLPIKFLDQATECLCKKFGIRLSNSRQRFAILPPSRNLIRNLECARFLTETVS